MDSSEQHPRVPGVEMSFDLARIVVLSNNQGSAKAMTTSKPIETERNALPATPT